ALCAAAEIVLAAEALARQQAGLVATVGQLEVRPGVSNVIPGQVTLSLDVRHQEDALRERAIAELHTQANRLAGARQVALRWQLVQEHGAVPCDPRLTGLLARAVESLGYPELALPSGAGHDAAVLAGMTPAAMLFVRCKGGISHHPAESVAPADVAVAIDVLSRTLELLATRGREAGGSGRADPPGSTLSRAL
ncbi:MAG TPA: M20/M25/M40 family metallo-hydrolase, partial [Roseiflexaceae bacterium]|nr:M20/M25/M40 family metallo-hydrolase [Roseiflexaceae bacterium]